jgi:2-polyprenyl-6-methoxyphenol hydroxylase-like FAD-dependent oxidoreductase
MNCTCCIVGGGPAGVMLGYLLARQNVDVVVLEKHADFLRDFRGDTVHPSTLEILYELGILEEFLQRPHTRVYELGAVINGTPVTIADMRHLPTHCKFVALMPQWEFLDFLAGKAKEYPTFTLRMRAEATDLIADGQNVRGVVVETEQDREEILADLVIAADGRTSVLREKAGLEIHESGAPIDVLWMRVGREGNSTQPFGPIAPGRIVVTLDRGDYWQVAYVIPKDGIAEVKRRGIEELRHDLVQLAPHLEDHITDIATWDDVKLLTVRVDRLKKWWKPGLLCIGDAAHAMSPIGGIGINLAIQDAVAAANILASPLRNGSVSAADLERVQKRRDLPTRLTQRVQVLMQDRVISDVLRSTSSLEVPWLVRMLDRWPRLRRLPARAVGLGVRPEHLR